MGGGLAGTLPTLPTPTGRHPQQTDTDPWQADTPSKGRPLQRIVRILLECILVSLIFFVFAPTFAWCEPALNYFDGNLTGCLTVSVNKALEEMSHYGWFTAKANVKATLLSDGFLEILNVLYVLSGNNDKKKM